LKERNWAVKRHKKLKLFFSHLAVLVLPSDQISAFTDLKLQIIKVGKLDVHGKPLFANPVTYWHA